MATYVIAAGDVKYLSTSVSPGVAGETIAAGEFVYRDSTNGLYYKAVNNVSAVKALCIGMAVCSALINQPVNVVGAGDIAFNSAIWAAKAKTLILSATAGKCADAGDIIAAQWYTLLGYTTATDAIKLSINPTGITV